MRQHSGQIGLSIKLSCLPEGVDYRMEWSWAGYNVLMPQGFSGLSFTGFPDSLLESWASGQEQRRPPDQNPAEVSV